VHLCIFDSEYLKCILVAVCLLSDSDSEDEIIHPGLDDDDQAPGDDSHWACPGQGALPPLAPAPAFLQQAEMHKIMQAAGGPNIENVVRGIDADMGLNPDPIPSERCGGQSRQALLKQKASHITRSTAETFTYLTSKTKSVEEAADVLESFGNVSLCVLFFLHISHVNAFYVLLHILHITADQCFSPLLRQRMCHIIPYLLFQKIYCRQ
jgi:hypothetical protein